MHSEYTRNFSLVCGRDDRRSNQFRVAVNQVRPELSHVIAQAVNGRFR